MLLLRFYSQVVLQVSWAKVHWLAQRWAMVASSSFQTCRSERDRGYNEHQCHVKSAATELTIFLMLEAEGWALRPRFS